jgi:hypothetical protein
MGRMWKWVERRIQKAVCLQLQQQHWLKHLIREQLQQDQKALEERIYKLFEQLDEAQASIVKSAEECERYALLCSSSKDADAHRWIELKRKVDSFDKVFQQLGVLIAKQEPH